MIRRCRFVVPFPSSCTAGCIPPAPLPPLPIQTTTAHRLPQSDTGHCVSLDIDRPTSHVRSLRQTMILSLYLVSPRNDLMLELMQFDCCCYWCCCPCCTLLLLLLAAAAAARWYLCIVSGDATHAPAAGPSNSFCCYSWWSQFRKTIIHLNLFILIAFRPFRSFGLWVHPLLSAQLKKIICDWCEVRESTHKI